MKFVILLLTNLLLITHTLAKDLTIKDYEVFTLYGEVDIQMAENFASYVDKVKSANKGEAIVLINSPGGSIISGFLMLDILQASKLKFTCIVRPTALSMAAIFLEYCDIRYATPGSLILFHEASGGLDGSIPKMTSRLSAITKLIEFSDKNIIKRLKITQEEYNKKCANEWWIATGQSAKEQNVVDDVVNLNIQYTGVPLNTTIPFENHRKTYPSYLQDYDSQNLDEIKQLLQFTR